MRIALQMEEKGREFYRRQEERYDKPEVKDIFQRLFELYRQAGSEEVKEAPSRLLGEEKKHLVELRESMEELS